RSPPRHPDRRPRARRADRQDPRHCRRHLHGRATRSTRRPAGAVQAARRSRDRDARGRGRSMTLLMDPPAVALAPEPAPGRWARLARAGTAGLELAELVRDPTGFAVRLHAAFADLAEPDSR